jgi:hypothetical protein
MFVKIFDVVGQSVKISDETFRLLKFFVCLRKKIAAAFTVSRNLRQETFVNKFACRSFMEYGVYIFKILTCSVLLKHIMILCSHITSRKLPTDIYISGFPLC